MPVWCRAVLLGFGFWVLYLATANYTAHPVNDVEATALAAWRLGQHGSVHLDGFRHVAWIIPSQGHFVSNRFPGAVLLATPFYWLLGHSYYTRFPGIVAATFVAAFALALAYVLLRKFVSEKLAVAGTVVLGLCTATWTVSGDALWTHGLGQVALAGALILLIRRKFLLAGLACGIAVLARPHLALVGAVLILAVLVGERRLRPPLWMSAGLLAGVAGLLLYNHGVFHAWSITGGYTLNTDDGVNSGPKMFPINVLGTLVSPERGLLVLMPFVIVLIPGLRRAWRRADHVIRGAAIAGLVYMGAQLYMNRFSGGNGFFGNRLVLESLVLWLPLAALAYQEWAARSARRQIAFAVLATYAFAIHALAAAVNWTPGHFPDPWEEYATAAQVTYANTWLAAGWFVLCTAALVLVILLMRRRSAGRSGPAESVTVDAATAAVG